nr:hypothetical protein Iba_chr11eCG13180 [Ipomoea batatas]
MTAGNRRDDDRPTLPSAAPPSAFTHRLPFAFTLLLCFSYATDDRPTLPSAIPPPAFTHRLRPNQHRLPSAFAHRLRTSTATLAEREIISRNFSSGIQLMKIFLGMKDDYCCCLLIDIEVDL